MNDESMRPNGVTPLTELAHLSGFDYVRYLVEGKLGNPPIAELMDFKAVEVMPGTVTFSGTPGRSVYNLIETVHGGYAATLLDTAMACAILSTLDAARSFTTLEIKINYVRAMTAETGPVFARGTVIQAGRRVATAEGRLTDSAGKLLAFGTTTCLVVPKQE
jgi:uncharacterized protein (TIGR00369 family)